MLLAADIERSVAYAQIQERGAGIDYTSTTRPNGFRDFGVHDPDGHDIAFGPRL